MLLVCGNSTLLPRYRMLLKKTWFFFCLLFWKNVLTKKKKKSQTRFLTPFLKAILFTEIILVSLKYNSPLCIFHLGKSSSVRRETRTNCILGEQNRLYQLKLEYIVGISQDSTTWKYLSELKSSSVNIKLKKKTILSHLFPMTLAQRFHYSEAQQFRKHHRSDYHGHHI